MRLLGILWPINNYFGDRAYFSLKRYHSRISSTGEFSKNPAERLMDYTNPKNVKTAYKVWNSPIIVGVP